jgi:hypothetical protein
MSPTSYATVTELHRRVLIAAAAVRRRVPISAGPPRPRPVAVVRSALAALAAVAFIRTTN